MCSVQCPMCRTPPVAHARETAAKSESLVLAVDLHDSSSTYGITEVLKKVRKFVPKISECGEVSKKTAIFGKLICICSVHFLHS